MAILEYSEVKERKIILHDGEPYEVVSSHVFRKQQRKPVNATKLKNLINGRMAEVSFQSSDKVEEADMSERKALYLYRAKGEVWFCDEDNKSKRFTISADIVGDKIKFVKENSVVTLHIFTDKDDNEKIIGVKLPIKVDLAVTEAPPSIKGNTATGGTKIVTLETGATIAAPLFIEVGEKIRINTDTGEYVERANT